MKNSFNIFTKDLKNIGTNWVAAILIGGLVLLPSLYAWFNIAASWDPYGQTDQIPIGIVNEDEGATVRDEEIDVGKELVESLKDNDSMDWQFVDRKEAMDKVEYGDYFSVIVIPKDFSEKLGSVITDNPEKASVEYFVNEKINAIAPKITQKGASVIVDEVSSNFISTVNGVIFDMFNEIGIEIENDLPDIERFESYIFEMEKRLPEIHKTLNGSLTDAGKAQDIIKKAKGEIPKAKETTKNGLETIDNASGFLKKAEDRITEMGPKIKADLEKAQNTASEINGFLNDIDTVNINFEKGKEIKKTLREKVDQSMENIAAVESALETILDQMKSAENPDEVQIEKIENAIEKLELINGALAEGQKNTDEMDQFIDDKKQEVDSILNNIKELSTNTSNRIDEFVKDYNENIEPTVLNEIANAKKTLSDARGLLTDVQSTIPEIESILSRTGGSLDEGKGTLEEILGEYPYVNDKVNALADRIREIQGETDINDIIDLLQNDPEAERGFFAEPVKLNENKLFPIENYGTGMTPFYTVLSIWVGCLLLISLLATDIVNSERFSVRQIYFGRLFTFLTIGFLQTLIVTSGDMAILHVNIAHPVWFVVFGLLISLVFMLIVYTLVSVFGDVGKAMAIVFLVLQIAGSGGTYPVALLPRFFQMINPFLPFTYAVDIMREAVGGIVWERVYHDMTFLAIFGLIAVLFGAFFKKIMNKQTHKLMKKSKESGLFH